MRLRHIPGAEETIAASPYVVQDPQAQKGRWDQLGSLTPENLASLMAAYFFVKFRKFLVRNSVIYDIIRLYHLS